MDEEHPLLAPGISDRTQRRTSPPHGKQYGVSDTAPAMSERNVKLARQMIDALNRGDIAEWASGLHKDIARFPLAENTQSEPVHGVDAVVGFVTDWLEPWDEYRTELTRIVDAGDWVVMATQQSGRYGAGPEISMNMYVAAAVRDGKVVEFRWFMNERDALNAAGMQE